MKTCLLGFAVNSNFVFSEDEVSETEKQLKDEEMILERVARSTGKLFLLQKLS